MKTTLYLLLSSIVFASACSSTNQSVKNTTDDVYYSSQDAKKEIEDKKAVLDAAAEKNRLKKTNPDNYTSSENTQQGTSEVVADDYYDPNSSSTTNSTSNTETDANGNTYVTNNYNTNDYSSDDYYDYAYASRIRRFHRPSSYWGYYDPFYTDLYYYNSQPSCWGTSIYTSYNFWSPNTTIIIGSNWGYNPWRPYGYYGYSTWGYSDPWYGYNYNPYGFGYGYGGYWNGYNQGYANGYWNGYYNGFSNAYNGTNYYYNSFENKNTYYGPRNSTATNGTGTHGRGHDRNTFGEKYERAVLVDRGKVNDIKPAVDEVRPVKNGINSETINSGRPNTKGNDVNTSDIPGKSNTTSPANTGRPNNSATTNPANDSPVKGGNATNSTTGKPKWTTKNDDVPVKGNTSEPLIGTGRPNHSNTTTNDVNEPVRPNPSNGGGRPNSNWNSTNTPRTSTVDAPANPRNENIGRPRTEPSRNPSIQNQNNETPVNVRPNPSQNEGRPRRNTLESAPRQDRSNKNNSYQQPRQERPQYEQPRQERPNFEQPRQESPRMQQNTPSQRENNSTGGGRRR
ncbi:MAG: hypothetical protein IPO70_03790 [Bacteroidetes bacterium]|nr:hypothetical protein [Bacteroidota bacterium]MBK9671371.1 hypothetical protein [Bacteroidota bacterium]